MVFCYEGGRLAEDSGHEYTRALSHYALGWGRLLQGHIPEAISHLERGLPLLREVNARFMIGLVTSELGWAYLIAGRGAEGRALLEEATARLTAVGVTVHLLKHALYTGEAVLLEGSRGRACARQTADRSRAHGQRPVEAGALRLLGDAHMRFDPPDLVQAKTSYRNALAIAEEVEARPLVAHCHLGLGKLYRRMGRREQAQEHLATATAMYREMSMTYWLEQAEAEVRELG